MSMQDPVADMLTRIRNAQAMGIISVSMPFSNLKTDILGVLKAEGFIEEFGVVNTNNKKDIEVKLRYYQGRPVIEKIKRVSRPALRVYRRSSELPSVRGGMGIAIISTPQGVMTDKTARAQSLGGEVLCTVE
jgi:small subunit ribosomal protein S8